LKLGKLLSPARRRAAVEEVQRWPSPLKPYQAGFWYPAHFRRSAMPGKRFKAEEIVNKLRQADVELARGSTVAAVCKLLGITDATYFRWRKEYGGMKVDQAKRLKTLEQENARLKRLLADAELDKAILREAAHA